MESDVKSTRLAASGAVFAGRGRVKGLSWVSAAAAGTIQVRDGGASGTVICTIDTPAGVTLSDNINIPGNGLVCDTDVYITLTNVTFCTAFYA